MIKRFLLLAFSGASYAHTAAWAPGMYCRGGTSGQDDQNTNTAVNPLYNLTKSDWWFQHDRGCDAFPPPAGEFLNLPAGGSVTVELAHNRGQTTLSFGGIYTSEWPDGGNHPEDWNAIDEGAVNGDCLSDGAMHATSQNTTWGTAFAISYQSELSAVTMENLAVFSVLEHTPWKRIATYEVPAKLPACGPQGCTCAWLWVPLHCGQSNMYMHGFKCNVTGATSTVPVAVAKPPVYCANGTPCVQGAKQMIAWQQLDGNNVVGDAPGYNTEWGWVSGAQNDIFEAEAALPILPTTSSTVIAPSAAATTLITTVAPATVITASAKAVTTKKPTTTKKATTTKKTTSTKKPTTTKKSRQQHR